MRQKHFPHSPYVIRSYVNVHNCVLPLTCIDYCYYCMLYILYYFGNQDFSQHFASPVKVELVKLRSLSIARTAAIYLLGECAVNAPWLVTTVTIETEYSPGELTFAS